MNAYETIRAVTRLSTFVVFLGATAALGILYESRLLLALFEAGTAYLLFSFLYVFLAARRVTVAREIAPRAYEEDEISIGLVLRYPGLLPLYLVQVQDWCPIEALPGKAVVVPELPGRGTPFRISYPAKCDRGRGRFTIGPIQVTVSDPLGLFRKKRIIAALSELIVYPKTWPIRDLGIRGIQPTAQMSSSNPQRVGQAPLFYGTREYQPGDNPRRIHWRASARWGRLVLKEFETPSDVELTCFLDLDRATLAGLGRGSNVERGISIAASAAEFAERAGHPYQLIAEGEEAIVLPARQGRRSLLAVLDTLARVKTGRTPYLELLRRGSRFLAEGSAVLLMFNRLEFDRDGFLEIASAWTRKGVQGIAVLIDDETFVPIEQLRVKRAPELMSETVRFLQSFGWTTFLVRSGDNLEKVFAAPGIPEAEVVS